VTLALGDHEQRHEMDEQHLLLHRTECPNESRIVLPLAPPPTPPARDPLPTIEEGAATISLNGGEGTDTKTVKALTTPILLPMTM